MTPENVVLVIWFGAGFLSHSYWWDKITEGGDFELPLFLLAALPATLFGPFTFLLEAFLFQGASKNGR